jgi:hypothetical protein
LDLAVLLRAVEIGSTDLRADAGFMPPETSYIAGQSDISLKRRWRIVDSQTSCEAKIILKRED